MVGGRGTQIQGGEWRSVLSVLSVAIQSLPRAPVRMSGIPDPVTLPANALGSSFGDNS